MINRRELLCTAVTAGAASVFVSNAGLGEDQPPHFRIVDTNVSLFQWPFRRLPLDEAGILIEKLRSLGVQRAWAGSFEGLFHRDVAGVNRRLAAACALHPELVAIGTVNPVLPDWQDDLRRCIDEHKMPGIRLHPNYHDYGLDDVRFGQLLQRAAEARQFVQLAASMEDTRTQHPSVQVPDVDLAPLAKWMHEIPNARVQILNYRPRPPLVDKLAELPGVFFDTARIEGTDGVPELAKRVSPARVMFGTHAPFLVPEAALIRTHEAGKFSNDELGLVLGRNAEGLLEKRSGKG